MPTKYSLVHTPCESGTYPVIPADYSTERHLAPRLRNNPLVAALPLGDLKHGGIASLFERLPEKPSAEFLRADPLTRAGELPTLGDLIYNLPSYQEAAVASLTAWRESYVGRNVLLPIDRMRRHLVHTASAFVDGKLSVPLPPGLRMTATSLALFGFPGTSKTTFLRSLSANFAVVIRHEQYKGQKLTLDQLPHLYLQIPFDATVKSFCLGFLLAIDDAMGYTDFYRYGLAAGGIAEMVILMARAATTVSLGMIFIDGFENLRVARGPSIVIMLNLLSALVELVGISVVCSGTPDVQEVLKPGAANQRKLELSGEIFFPLMKWDSDELNDFMSVLWGYRYVTHSSPLTPEVRKAWFEVGGGNPAFMVMAYALAQRNELGGRELIDEIAFERVRRFNMATLAPAIRAMRFGRTRFLSDMEISRHINDLRKQLGAPALPNASFKSTGDEFEEVVREQAKCAGTGTPRKGKATADSYSLPPFENPLLLR